MRRSDCVTKRSALRQRYGEIDVVVILSGRADTMCDLNVTPLFVALTVIGPLGTLNMNATPSALVVVALPFGSPFDPV